MILKQLLLTQNACYKAGVKMKPKGIMVHSTGANNPNLFRYVGPDDGILGVNKNNNHWNQDKPGGRSVCVHAFIGKAANGDIYSYQTLPWDMRGWHGGGKSNDTHIGFEICEDNLTDAVYFNKVYTEAVELCAYLCKEYQLDPLADGVLICHCEGFKRGIASNHGDVMHWFPKHGKSMDTFRADVKAVMQGAGVTVNIPRTTANSTTATTAGAKNVDIGSIVAIKAGAVYGGLASTRGKPVPGTQIDGKRHTVNGIATHNGIREARLKEINSWVAVSSLTVVHL